MPLRDPEVGGLVIASPRLRTRSLMLPGAWSAGHACRTGGFPTQRPAGLAVGGPQRVLKACAVNVLLHRPLARRRQHLAAGAADSRRTLRNRRQFGALKQFILRSPTILVVISCLGTWLLLTVFAIALAQQPKSAALMREIADYSSNAEAKARGGGRTRRDDHGEVMTAEG